MGRASLPALARIKKRGEFLAMQKESGSRKLHTPNLLIVVCPAARGVSRIGITVTVKIDKRSTVRNRVKRYIRECFRRLREDLVTPIDVVVIARNGSATCSCEEIGNQISQALQKGRYL